MVALCFLEYTDDEAHIPKHSSVIVRRTPIGGVKPAGRTFIVCVFLYSLINVLALRKIFSLAFWFIANFANVCCYAFAEIVLTQLWLDLLDPYVKQTQNNTLSSSSHLSLPLYLALVTSLENIMSTEIQLNILFTCFLYINFVVLQIITLLFDVFLGKWLVEVTTAEIICYSKNSSSVLFWK